MNDKGRSCFDMLSNMKAKTPTNNVAHGRAGFKSADDYKRFAESIRNNSRYIQSVDVKRFLKAVLETSEKRKIVRPRGIELYRAQRGCSTSSTEVSLDKLIPHPIKRMYPRTNQGPEGRANSKGIPHLYLAFERETALSEMRPPKPSNLTLAACRTNEDLTLVDCSWQSMWQNILQPDPQPGYEEMQNWFDIDTAFSKPVDRSDDVADYAPTQVLAEAFRHHGYQGIIFKSEMAEKGMNIVLFDPSKVEIINLQVFSVLNVAYSFEHGRQIDTIKKQT
jgi:hypothetical protein